MRIIVTGLGDLFDFERIVYTIVRYALNLLGDKEIRELSFFFERRMSELVAIGVRTSSFAGGRQTGPDHHIITIQPPDGAKLEAVVEFLAYRIGSLMLFKGWHLIGEKPPCIKDGFILRAG